MPNPVNPLMDQSGNSLNTSKTGTWTLLKNKQVFQTQRGTSDAPPGPKAQNGEGWIFDPDPGQDQKQGEKIAGFDQSLYNRQGPSLTAQDASQLAAARGQQTNALGLMQNYASGNGPSVSEAQTYGNLGSNIAAMNAASQGPSGPANAMATGYGAGVRASFAGAGQRSQEQAGLMQAYGQGAGKLGASDIAQFGTDTQQLGRAGQLAAQQGILNAQTIFGVNQQEANNQEALAAYQQGLWQQQQQQKSQQMGMEMQAINAGMGAMKSYGSDERMKKDVQRGGLMGAYK